MSLVDSWTDTYTATSTASRDFTVPIDIAVGTVLFVAVGRGGSGTVTEGSLVDSKGNTYLVVGAGPHSGNTLNVALFRCEVEFALAPGDTITIGASAASNRWALVAGVFDEVLLPFNEATTASVTSSATSPVTDTTASLTAGDALVVMAIASTAAGMPATASGGSTLVDAVETAVGSSDRGVALLYRVDTTPNSTRAIAAALVSSGPVSASVAGAYESDTTPPAGPTVTLWDGASEVAVTLSIWDGATEVPVTFEVT
jgi:hypothetical protein